MCYEWRTTIYNVVGEVVAMSSVILGAMSIVKFKYEKLIK